MGLKKLALAMIMVNDFQAMKDFYSKTLGLETTEVDDDGQWATFKLPDGGAEIAIHGGIPIPAEAGAGRVVPTIEVEAIRDTVEELKGRGVEIAKEVHETVPDLLLADIRDPEGNLINLYESTGGGTHGD